MVFKERKQKLSRKFDSERADWDLQIHTYSAKKRQWIFKISNQIFLIKILVIVTVLEVCPSWNKCASVIGEVCWWSVHSPAAWVSLPPWHTVARVGQRCCPPVQGRVWCRWCRSRKSPARARWRCRCTQSSRPAWRSRPWSPAGSTAWCRRGAEDI